MTPDDFDRAAVDLDLYRRASARCAAAEPHRDADEDWPCSGCLLASARSLAIASNLSAAASTVTGGSAATGAVDGAAGHDPGPPPTAGVAGGSTPQKDNRPGTRNPRAAEGATAIARTEGT